MPHFTIVIPTIRSHKQVAPAIMRCWETLTQPTDLLVLHGDRGKSATINGVINKLSETSSLTGDFPPNSFLVLADDDFVFPPEWQDSILQAFQDLPDLGIAGLCFPKLPKYESYMAQWPEFQQQGGTAYQPVTHGNIVGACLVMPTNIAVQIGQHPVNADIHYSYDDDGWRCFRARQLGKTLAYVKCSQDALIADYGDTPEYIEQKQRDIAKTKERGLTWLR